MGCGYKRMDGFTSVDHDPNVCPDICHDLESFPWPIKDNDVDEIHMIQVLEHLCPFPKDYKKLWQEIYRVCQNGAKIVIEVPHWLHENFYHDPTHVRRITPITLAMMSQARNQQDIQAGGQETTLGLQWHVDFELKTYSYGYDQIGTPVICHFEVLVVKPERFRKIASGLEKVMTP